MTKFTPKNLNSGFADIDSLNENFNNLATFSDTCLSRDGTSPNTMLSNLDMNSNRIINLPDAVTANEPATLGQVLGASAVQGFVSTVVEKQIATADQTVFTLTLTTYTPGVDNLSVYINGAYQDPSVYVQTSTSVVTLLEPAALNDEVVFVVNQRNVSADTFPAASVTYTDYESNNTNVKAHLDRGAEGVEYTPAGAGAVATDVQAKLRRYVDVRDFGALGDGTDQTTAILNCRTYCIANKLTMRFNGGTYLMSQPLVLSPGLIVEGQGADATILKLANGANCNLVESIYPSPGVDYIYLKGMYLDGNAANNTAGYCIEMEWVAIPSFIEDVTCTVGYDGGIRLYKCSAVEFHRVWGTAGGSVNGGRVLDIDSYRSLTFVGGGFEYPAQGATETIRIRNTAGYSSPLASFHGVHFEHYVGGSYANCNVFDIGGGANDAELLAGLSIHGGQVLGIGTASGNYFIRANDDFINVEISGGALSNMTGWCTNFNAVANIPPAAARHIGHWVYGNRTRVRNAIYSHHQGSVGATTNSFMRLIATGVTGTVTAGGATSVAVTIDTQPDTAYHVFVMPTAGHIGNNIIATAPDADKTTTDFDIRFINITTGAASALGVNSAFRYFVFSTT